MRKIIAAAAAAASACLVSAGPISRFEEKPSVDFDSKAKIGDIERCLIDIDSFLVPTVYSQKDRPDVVNVVFRDVANMVRGRVELTQLPNSTHVRIWLKVTPAAEQCAPR